ncbi:hypothetical protein ACLBUY_12210, partial [Pseudomonas aeruginosa]
MVEASLTLLDTQQVDDCWNRIGVHGDKSCERLAEHVHCRNCEVYAAAATYLLDRIALRQDQLDSAETMPVGSAGGGMLARSWNTGSS